MGSTKTYTSLGSYTKEEILNEVGKVPNMSVGMPESMGFKSLENSLKNTKWREGATKVVVVITDTRFENSAELLGEYAKENNIVLSLQQQGSNSTAIKELSEASGAKVYTVGDTMVDGLRESVLDSTQPQPDKKYTYKITQSYDSDKVEADDVEVAVDKDGAVLSNGSEDKFHLEVTRKDVTERYNEDVDVKITFYEDEKEVGTQDVLVPLQDTVEVSYVDTEGNCLAESDLLKGEEGEEYSSSPKEIDGYKKVSVNGDERGKFTKGENKIAYIYAKEIAVVVKYQDENGKELKEPENVSGLYEGDSYDVSTDEYKKAIDGYELKEEPSNSRGILGKSDVEVTYVYKKVNEQGKVEKPKELPKTASEISGKLLYIVVGILLFSGTCIVKRLN